MGTGVGPTNGANGGNGFGGGFGDGPGNPRRFNRGVPMVQTAPIVRSYGTLSSNTTLLLSTADVHLITLGANITLTLNTSASPDRTKVRVYLTQDGTGSRTVTWAGVTWFSGSAPTLTTAAASIDVLEFTFASSTTSPTWYGRAIYTKTVAFPGNVTIAGTLGVTGAVTLTVPLSTANGGTGLASYTGGDLPYYASGTAFTKLAIGAANRVLTSTGSAPQWVNSLSLGGTFDVAGNLNVNGTKFSVVASSGNFTSAGSGTIAGLLDISGASAGQIKFPATQNTSANANTLDDYEEGTWTPTLGGSATYTLQSGSYVKIGRSVQVQGKLAVNVLGTGSTTTISGLPFAEGAGLDAAGSLTYFASLASGNVVYIAPEINQSGSSITFNSLAAAGATVTQNTAIFGAGTRVDFTISYQAAT